MFYVVFKQRLYIKTSNTYCKLSDMYILFQLICICVSESLELDNVLSACSQT